MSKLGLRISEYIGEATALKSERLGLNNAENNRPYFGKTIDDLPEVESLDPEKPVIVVNAGPSLHRKNSIAKILASGFKGDIIAVDSSLGYCLRGNLMPNYVLTVDPDYYGFHMVRMFGDNELESRPADDFFVRRNPELKQLEQDQIRRNRELIELVNQHGKNIKAIIATSVPLLVTKRCVESSMDMYWWNPIYDDYDKPDSISRKLFEENKIPCMVTGGKVGTSAWIFAHAVLGRKHVALVGEDIGYAPNTPLLYTQFYKELVEILGEDRVADAFIDIHNPYLNETWFVDPTFYWYRNIFLELVREADCITYNCTEGGTLFGDSIQFIPLDQFLSKFSKTSASG